MTTHELSQRMSATASGLYLDETTTGVYIDQVLAAAALGREWLFILEDDVRVLGPISSELDHDLNGVNPWVRLPHRVTVDLLMARRRPRLRGYGGCGGSILRTATLLDSPVDEVKRFLTRAVRRVGRPLGSDEVLSAWILYNRGRLGPYDGFAETWYADYQTRLDAGRVSVVHQFKDDYT